MSLILERAEKMLLRDKYDNGTYSEYLKNEFIRFIQQYVVADGPIQFNADTSDGLVITMSVKVKKLLPVNFS